MHSRQRAMKARFGLLSPLPPRDAYTSAPLGQLATFTLEECTGGGASKGKRQVSSSQSAPIDSPQTVQPSGAEPQPAQPSKACVATAHLEGTYGAGGLFAAMSTVPYAGEFRCLGPRQRTASKLMTPAHASTVSAHSVGTGRDGEMMAPFLSYHGQSSAPSLNAVARALCDS